MKLVWIVLLLGLLVACGGSAPDDERAAIEGEPEAEEAPGEQMLAELPPQGALPLSGIVAALEAEGYRDLLEVEFEDGVWDVDCLVNGEEWEITVDPLTGKVLSSKAEAEAETDAEDGDDAEEDEAHERPPEGGVPLSGILAVLEAEGYGPIYEVEFGDGFWEAECLSGGEQWEGKVDPLTDEYLASEGD